MTTVRRAYIRPNYDQAVDDGCLEWKSIPMAVVQDVVKVEHAKNDYTGIKQIYNVIPPRPTNINTLATSIARINNLTYSSAVPMISKQFINEETADVKKFVSAHAETQTETNFEIPPQTYVPEQPTHSSSGKRLTPTAVYQNPIHLKLQAENLSLLLGDVSPTSGVVPFNVDMGSQTEWINSKEQGFMKRDITFANVEAGAEESSGGMEWMGRKVGHYRSGMATQTDLSKPPSGRNIPSGTSKGPQRFFESPDDRFGTISGTPTNRLSRIDQANRIFGEHYTTPSRFPGDSASSGLNTPK
jgi:hypothetical protein